MNLKVFLIILTTVFISCTPNKQTGNIEIKVLQDYGDEKENILSYVTDFDYYNGKVYILDNGQASILIFNINGEFISSLQLKPGQGPGEFTPGVSSFEVISDSILAVLDQMAERIAFISATNKYLSDFNVKFMPHKLFYRDSLLYISGNSEEKLIWVYDLNGELLDTLITPFNNNNLPVRWVSEVAMDKDGAFYITNPYKTEIVKWHHNKILWKFSDDKLNLVKPPKSKVRGKSISMYQTRGWTTNGIFTFGNYLIASTFSNDIIKGKKLLPHILVLDKNTGELLFKEEREQLFRAKSFQNGRFVFMAVYEPFPQLKRIDLKIIRE